MTVLSQLTKAVGTATLTGALFKPVVQGIWAVKVWPTAHRVTLKFLTTQQCVPLIEIFSQTGANRYSYEDMVPSNLVRTVWPAFAGKRWQHEVVVDNLEEASNFWFRITAYPDPSIMPGMTPAYQSGWFATSKRTMTIDIDEIRVERAGDPSGDGELRMLFCIWNYATRKPIFTYKLPKGDHWANISDGHVETAILEKKVSIVSPPDYLGFFTECEDNDRWPFPMGLTGVLGEPALDESMTPFRQYENVTDWDTVRTLDIFHVPDANGAQGFKLTLDSGEWKLWYKFTLSIIVRTTPSKQPPLVFGHFDSGHELTEIPVHTMSLVPGRGAAQRAVAGDKADFLIAVSDDGRLRWSPRIGREFTQWQSLPDELQGSVAITSTADHASHLFAIGVDGRMRHACLDDAKQASWHDLGGSLTGHPAVLQAPDGKKLWLFALDPNGAVQFCEVAAGARRTTPRWRDLGGAFASGLTAQVSNGERCHLFALDSQGSAHHLLLAPGGSNGHPRWRRLGARDLVTLTAVPVDDGGLALLGLDRQRRMFGKLLSARVWLPENEDWVDLGDYDTFGWKEQRPRTAKGKRTAIKPKRTAIKPGTAHPEVRARAA